MEFRSKNDFLMWSLIRTLGSQKAVAKALNQSKQTFNYWLNHANKVPSNQILAMEVLLKRLQHKERQVARSCQAQSGTTRANTPNPRKYTPALFHISQRAQMAMQFEEEIINPAGRPSKLQTNPEKNQRGVEPQGRSAASAAKRFWFGSKDSYLRAKKVILNGIPEVVKAMDQGYITISQAALLVTLPEKLQFDLLLKPKKERANLLKQRELAEKAEMEVEKAQKSQLIQIIMSDEEPNLIKCIFKSSQSIPLSFVFKHLIACCNEPDELKSKLASFLPSIGTDFDIYHFLQALTQYSLNEKNKCKGETVYAND